MPKKTRKELLNTPDEFVATTGSLVSWYKENKVRFATIVLITAVIIASSIGILQWKTAREENAMSLYFGAAGDPLKITEIAKDYADTEAGKISHLRLAEIAYSNADYEKAISSADEFVNGWGREDMLYWQSVLIMSCSLINQDMTDKALVLLDECIKDAPGNIRDQALFYRGTALNELGRTEESRQSLAQISSRWQDLARNVQPLKTLPSQEIEDAKQ